tara:strand:+ start:50 stop:604 length:555 start_codon:yes stop_codon:yes gene_type:complete
MINYNLKKIKIQKEIFILTSKIYNTKLLLKLKDYVVKKSSIIFSKNSNVHSARTSFKALINNDEFFGFLKESKDIIYNAWKKDYVIHDAWGCVYRNPDNYCKRHNHLGTTAFSGILYLTDHGPGTYFPELNLTVKEEVGKFVIFDPMLYHEVPKYKYTKERVTVAFNCDEHQFLMNSKTTKILK